MQANSPFKKFLVKRAKRSWIIAIGVVIALVVGGVYIAPDLINKVREGIAASKTIEHTDWSGGPGQLMTNNPHTDSYDQSANIDVTAGSEGIKLKTLDQQGATTPTVGETPRLPSGFE
jgi:hypothetical protein